VSLKPGIRPLSWPSVNLSTATGSTWRGHEDITGLADAAAKTAAIFNQDDRLVWLTQINGAGALVPVSGAVLHEIIAKHIVTPRLVNRGTTDEPNWACEYVPFEVSERTASAPLTAETLKEGNLIARVMKV